MSTPGFAAFRAVQIIKPSSVSNQNINKNNYSYTDIAQSITKSITKVYSQLTENVVQQVVQLLKHNFTSSECSSLLPTILINMSLQATRDPQVLSPLECCLENELSCNIVKFNGAANVSAEVIKNTIAQLILSNKHVMSHLGKSANKSTKSLPSLSYSTLAKIVSKKQKPIIIILEDIERMDARNLSCLMCILSNHLASINVALILTTNSYFYSLHSSISIKARDKIMLHEVKRQSTRTLFTQIVNQSLLLGTYSFKFGPSCLSLLLDRFNLFDSSIESIIHLIRSMLFHHFRQLNNLAILCTSSNINLQDTLSSSSSADRKLLYNELSTLPSLKGKNLLKSKSQIDSFILQCLDNIDRANSDLVSTLEQIFLFVYRADSYIYLTKGLIECMKLSIDKSPTVRACMRRLASFSLEEVERSVEYYLNNIGPSVQVNEMVESLLHELPHIKEQIEHLKKSQDCAMDKVDLDNVKTRSNLRERLEKSIHKDTKQIDQVFGSFRSKMTDKLEQVLSTLSNPLTLPMSEIVYFNDAAIVDNSLYPSVRLNIINKLKEKSKRPLKKDMIDSAQTFHLFTHSSATVNLNDLVMESENGCGRKKAKFVIDDMEYIGLLQREKNEKIKKLVWE